MPKSLEEEMIVRKILDQVEPSFKPYVLEICVGTAKDHSILCALFSREMVVPEAIQEAGGLATYRVSKDELSKFMSGVYSRITK